MKVGLDLEIRLPHRLRPVDPEQHLQLAALPELASSDGRRDRAEGVGIFLLLLRCQGRGELFYGAEQQRTGRQVRTGELGNGQSRRKNPAFDGGWLRWVSSGLFSLMATNTLYSPALSAMARDTLPSGFTSRNCTLSHG